jgi:hypothetical protein
MKKISIGLLLLLSAALLGAQTARIREIRGTVEIKTPGATAWQPAEPGQVLDKAALISTGFKSSAIISIGNSHITVRPLTRLSLEELLTVPGNEQVVLGLRAGRVRADVKPPAGGKVDFSVRSPSVTASVRGTVFDFDGLRLRVDEGRVYLAGTGAPGVYVGEGHGSAVNPETGKAAVMIETLKEELSPPLPAGIDKAPAATGPGTGPSNGELGIGFDWTGEE